ncbi:MAG: hypothetical protein Q8Q14_05325 [Gemmatimonadales bacterium]|nr:hypothetical protein [Gemmatimonadales bacterium]
MGGHSPACPHASGWTLTAWEDDTNSLLRRSLRYWRHTDPGWVDFVAADVRINGDGHEVRWRAWWPDEDLGGNGNGRPVSEPGAFEACQAEADAALACCASDAAAPLPRRAT